MNPLDITSKTQFDDTIVKLEYHPHLPYASATYGPSDEIRIPFQQTDVYVWPSRSSLIIEGKINNHKEYTFSNNAAAHLFSDIKLEINGITCDSTRFPGIATTLKGYCSFSKAAAERLQAAGWKTTEKSPVVDPESGYFNICLPLNTLLGLLEDYDKILLNVRLELVLIRANRDENAFVPLKADSTTAPSLKIERISWNLPYVYLNDKEKLKMMGVLERNLPLEIPFRSWSLHTYPTLPQTTSHTWTIKTSNQLEKPRFVVLALQTGRNANYKMDASSFDSCKLKNCKLFVGAISYPYSALQLDFSKRALSWLYEMYANFQNSYYGREECTPMFNYDEFIKTAPIVVIDCSHQFEATTSSTVDIRLELEFYENVPPNTSAHCLIIHDQLVTYFPLSGIVSKGI